MFFIFFFLQDSNKLSAYLNFLFLSPPHPLSPPEFKFDFMFLVLLESSKHPLKLLFWFFQQSMTDILRICKQNLFFVIIWFSFSLCCSTEFGSIVEIALTAVLGTLIEDVVAQSGGSLTSGMALAKLLARVAQMGPMLLGEPGTNRFIQIIQSVPEVEVFFTLLYANMPTP